ncbi:MAG: winged helix-turn-helix transcriptional regulator [Phycisphaerales bacterium]|nr:winged helix-turn-helix transcriptional regulator [Phycisphaerales bacterium]
MVSRKIRSNARTAKTPRGRTPAPTEHRAAWTFLSNHAHVLLLIAKEPEIRLRDVAVQVGITERAVQRIVSDLEEGNYLERERIGRRNRYKVHRELPLRHPIEAHRRISSLIALVIDG